MEFMEDQQLIIQQLKEMLRKSERELQDKDKELEDTAAKLQKFKLQSKAKISQLTNQLKEKEKIHESSSSENIPANTSATDSLEQKNRGKVIMLKKQLDDAKQMYDKMERDLVLEKEMLQNSVAQLQAQLKEKDEILSKKVSASTSSELTHYEKEKESGRVQEMYAQMVYKDSKIMELNELVAEKERKIMDLQEFVKEKEEVLQTRNRAIQLMTEDLNRKGKSVSDQLDSTRDEMRLMQEDFIAKESIWKEQREELESEMRTVKQNHNSLLNNQSEEIVALQASVQKLEAVRFDLAAKNAELQEKVVKLQDDFSKYKKDAENEKAQMDTLRKALVDTESQMDAKVLKARVKERTKLKALERQLEELKSGDQTQVAALQQRIAELEEEKGTLQLKLLGFEENSSSQESDEKEGSPHSFGSESSSLVEKLRNEIAELEKKMEDQRINLEDSQNQLHQIKESYKQKELESNKLKEFTQELLEAKEEICKKMDALQLCLNEKDIKITEMTTMLSKFEEEKVSFEVKIIELEEQKDLIENREKELLHVKECWQGTLENEKQVLMDIQKEKDEALAELEETKISCKTMEEQNIRLQNDLSNLQDGCDQLAQKNISLQEELHLKANEYEKQSREMVNLEQQLDHAQGEFTKKKEGFINALEQRDYKEKQLMAFFNQYSISDISDLQLKWKENLDLLNDLENTLETETISKSLQIKELEHMLETKEISFMEEILNLKEIIKNVEFEKHSLEALISEKDDLISGFQKSSNEKEVYLLNSIKEKEKVILGLSAELNEMKNLREQIAKYSEENKMMDSELIQLRNNLDKCKLNIADLKEQLNKSNTNNQKIQQELLELKSQKEHVTLQFDAEVKQHKDATNELNKKLQAIQTCLEDAYLPAAEDNDTLSLEEKLSTLLLERSNYKLRLNELLDELSVMAEEKNELGKKLSIYETEYSVFQEMHEKAEKEIENYKEQLATSENITKKYESEVCTLNKILVEKEEEISILTRKLASSECNVETNCSELQKLFSKFSDLSQRYKEAVACNEEIEREILTKVSEINDSHKINEQLQEEIKSLQSNNNKMQEQLEEMVAETEMLKETLIEKEKLYNLLHETLVDKEAEVTNLKNCQKRFDNLDSNLCEANEKISKLEMELETKTKYLQVIEQRLQENALAMLSKRETSDEAEQHEKEEKTEIDLQQLQTEQTDLDKATFYGTTIEQGIQNFISINGILKNELAAASNTIATLKCQHDSETSSLTKMLEKETENVACLKEDVENMKLARAEMVTNFNTATQALQDKIQMLELEKGELLKEIMTYEQVNSTLSEQVAIMKNNEESYKDRITKLEQKISENSEQINEMSKKCQDLSKQLSDSSVVHAKLESMNVEMEKLKSHTEEESLKHLEEKISNEKLIGKYKAISEQLGEENEEWKGKASVTDAELDKQKSRLQQCEVQIQEMLTQLKEKEDKITMLEAQSMEFHKKLKNSEANIERLQFFEIEYHATITQFKDIEDTLKEKEISIQNLIKEKENILSSKKELETEILGLSEQLKDTEETFSKQKVALQQHIKESSNKLIDLDTKLSESKHTVSELENALQERELLLSAHDDENKALLSKLEMLENLHSGVKSDLEKLSSDINNEREENNALKEYIKKMEDEKLKLVDHTHSLEREILSSQSKLLELKDVISKCEALELELLNSKEHILLLESDSTDNVQKLSSALEKANIHIHDQESKINFLESNLENAKKIIQETEDHSKSLEDEVGALKSNATKITEERENECRDLRIQLEEMEASNKDLQQQIVQLQLSGKEMRTSFEELVEKCTELSSKVTLLSSQLQEAEETLSKYEDIVKIQEKDLKRQREDNEQLNSENVQIANEKRILEIEYQKMSTLNHFLKEQIETLQISSQQQDEKHNAAVLEYQSEIDALRMSLEKSGKALTELQIQCSELQSANFSLKASMKCLQDEKDPSSERQNVLHELQNSNNALEYEIQSLRSEFCKIEEERNHLVSCLNEMSRKAQNLEQKLLVHADEKASLLEEIANFKTINENLQKDKNLKVNSLETELERLSAENMDLYEKLNTNNKQQPFDLEMQISEYRDKIACLEAKLRDWEMTIETLASENNLKKSIEDELKKMCESYTKVKTEKESLENDISDLKNITQNKTAEYDELAVKYGELLSSKEALSLDLQKLYSDYQALQKENTLLKEDSEKTRNKNKNDNKPGSDSKIVTRVIMPSDSVPHLEKEMIQQKENASDMTQKLLKENETMKSSLDVQKIKLEKMFAKLKAFKEKNDNLQEENRIANTKLGHIEKEKEMLESEITEKTELFRRMTSEGEKSTSLYQKDISERENIITRLKEENRLLATKCQQIEVNLHECSKSREDISLTLDKKNRELDDLLIRLQQMEKIQSSLEEQLANYNRQCTQLHYEKDCVHREVEDMKGQMEMLVSDNETFQSLLENIQKSKAALETELLKQREQHAKTLKEAQNKHLQDVEKLKNALHQSEQTVSALQDQCRNFEEKCVTSDQHLQSSSVGLADKEKENAFLQEQNHSLSNELTRVLKELHSLKSFSNWESDVMDAENDWKTTENKKETQDEKLMAALKESELKLQQKVNMLEYELQQQGNEYQLKLQEMERNALELHFQLNEMVTKNESLSEILTDKEKQWTEEANIWQQKEASLQLQIRNLESKFQMSSRPAAVQKEQSIVQMDNGTFQDSKSGKLMEDDKTNQLKEELQQVMYSLHSQSLRSENLSQEVSKLIEEKNMLQHQLSYYVNMAHSKEREQYQRSVEGEGIIKHLSENTFSTAKKSTQQNANTCSNTVPSNEELHSKAETRLVNVQLELENLYQRIQESKHANDELQKINECLDEELRVERARRKVIEEELSFAKEEAILNLQKPPNNEYQLLIDDDEPQMFPETNYSISRRVKTHAYRLQHWLRRKRNHCYRICRRMPGLQVLFYIYILIIHVWFLICLF